MTSRQAAAWAARGPHLLCPAPGWLLSTHGAPRLAFSLIHLFKLALLQCTSSPTSLPLKHGAWPLRPLLPAAMTSCCWRWRAAAATACACWMSTARRRWVPSELLLLRREWAGVAAGSCRRRSISSSCWAWASQRRLAGSPEHCIPLEGAAACGMAGCKHAWQQQLVRT